MASSRASVHSADSGSVASGVPLHKRLLFPSSTPAPIFTLPTLSTSCDEPLYQLLALICREHILPWYSRLTRDRTFLLDVVMVITEVVRSIEARLAHVDLAAVVAVELPGVVERHYRDVRTAKATVGSAYAAGLAWPDLFHSLQPHPGVDLDPPSNSKLGIVSAAYLSNLVDGILAACLPPEDAAAETERAVVREVIIYVILAGVFARVAQPYFVHQQIVKLLRPLSAPVLRSRPKPVWLSILLALASFFSLVMTGVAMLASWLGASGWKEVPIEADLARPSIDLARTALRADERPTVAQAAWLADMVTGLTEGACDRAVRRQLDVHLLNADRLAHILAIARDALFPDGHPAPSPPEPDEVECAQLRLDAEVAIGALLPDALLAYLLPELAAEKRRAVIVVDLLGAFDSHSVNVHLILVIVDLCAGKLFPELLAAA